MRLVFDLESNGLLFEANKLWIICATDLDSGKKYQWRLGDLGWQETFSSCKQLIGHNIIGYDLIVLYKLFKWRPSKETKIVDTLLLSQILDYNRFSGKHSLEAWGEFLGYPKVVHEDWSQFSEEMVNRCETDVLINVKVFNHLVKELNNCSKKDKVKTLLKVEHAVAKWAAKATFNGWKFDLEKAIQLEKEVVASIEEIAAKLEPLLGIKAFPKDKLKGEIAIKRPKWTKAGKLVATVSKWFETDDPFYVLGAYCRVEFRQLRLNSSDDVKIFLYKHGWVPLEYNYVKNADGSRRKTSAKITPESLTYLGEEGQLYKEYLTALSRHGVLKGWLENVNNGRLHGNCFTIGTPSMRSRHSVIVNIPSGESKWGKEMRELFTVDSGWVLVGCDSAGNQARGLAHYLKDDEFIDTVLNKDIHIYNAKALISVLNEMGVKHDFTPETMRPKAKRVLYAFLFGASGAKLWSYIFGELNSKKGARLKDGFIKSVPGFESLMETLNNMYTGSSKDSKKRFIVGIGGNKIYSDSPHKLLVYLLQAAEKATCSAACYLLMEYLEQEKIPYKPCIMMHDELDFAVPIGYEERAKELGIKAFKEGPKMFGIEIMDGDGKIGNNWYEIH